MSRSAVALRRRSSARLNRRLVRRLDPNSVGRVLESKGRNLRLVVLAQLLVWSEICALLTAGGCMGEVAGW